MFTATYFQIATYLLAICPFSIAFLVFLNSSVSFVLTDLVHLSHGVGNAVGTLGFADELLALVACPFWGVLSDRIGVRAVCVIGYSLVALSLVLFVQCRNVYPQLLLGRLLFSTGGSAVATMVTAVLPTMVGVRDGQPDGEPEPNGRGIEPEDEERLSLGERSTDSASSENTITPVLYQSQTSSVCMKPPSSPKQADASSTSQIAGLVGMAAGCGALLSLFLFLPLPQRFQSKGYSPEAALKTSYSIVAAVALGVAGWCFFGLRGLQEPPSQPQSHRLSKPTHAQNLLSHLRPFLTALRLPLSSPAILLGYTGGVVARASSVAISLFIPLLVNASFREHGLCPGPHSQPHNATSPLPSDDDFNNLPGLKRTCAQAYTLASILTGISQLVALLCAPLFGYIGTALARRRNHNYNHNHIEPTKQPSSTPLTHPTTIPLSTASIGGIAGYTLLATSYQLILVEIDTTNPVSTSTFAPLKGHVTALTYLAVCLVGFSQIGAIVGSLGVLGSGVLEGQGDSDEDNPEDEDAHESASHDRVQGSAAAHTLQEDESNDHDYDDEENDDAQQRTDPSSTPLLPSAQSSHAENLQSLKGSIAGVYSLFGGLGILILTKLGGWMFDVVGPGAPFAIMAVFNAGLLAVCGIVSLTGRLKVRRKKKRGQTRARARARG